MFNRFKNMPLFRSLKRISSDRDVGTIIILLLLTAAALATLITPLTHGGRETLLRAHHLRVQPFAVWSALQFVPSMYSYANQVWVSRAPLDEAALAGRTRLPHDTHAEWVNHYPPRIITFGPARAMRARNSESVHYYLQSRYGDAEVTSHYVAAASEGRVRVQLVESGRADGE